MISRKNERAEIFPVQFVPTDFNYFFQCNATCRPHLLPVCLLHSQAGTHKLTHTVTHTFSQTHEFDRGMQTKNTMQIMDCGYKTNTNSSLQHTATHYKILQHTAVRIMMSRNKHQEEHTGGRKTGRRREPRSRSNVYTEKNPIRLQQSPLKLQR